MLNPYNLEDHPDGDKKFVCDNGREYLIYYIDTTQSCDGIKVFSIGFDLLNKVRVSGSDERVSHTICFYFDALIAEHDCILVYTPSSEMNRSREARTKLFDDWNNNLNQYFRCGKLTTERIELSYPTDEGEIEIITPTVFYKEGQASDARRFVDEIIPKFIYKS